jgi:hypothetical protein
MEPCDIRRDYRFTIENQYQDMVSRLESNVIPVAVFDSKGNVLGWQLHGWKPPPPKILYVPFDRYWWFLEI